MLPLMLAGLSAVSAAVAVLLLRRPGAGWRVGRLLAATPERTLDDVVAMAERGEGTYVRVTGRVGSDEEFPDEHDDPLVYQRRRLERAGDGPGWTTLQDERLAVPFWIEARGVRVAIDVDALADGLVVVPRVAQGRAAELGSTGVPIPADTRPESTVRLRVEQVSAVDHATACGAVSNPAGVATLTAGRGRPLVLTTLESDVAMRLLAAEARSAVRLAAGLLVAAAVAAAAALVAAVADR